MSQPIWKRVANLGDASPLEHGGYFVYEDQTGVYAPEAEYFQPNEDEDDDAPVNVYRFVLEPCTYIDGVLSDNPYHPSHAAWFAGSDERARPQDTTYLSNICRCCDISEEELIALFCSDSSTDRAWAWRMVGDYHGFDNLDSCPLRLTQADLAERYPEFA